MFPDIKIPIPPRLKTIMKKIYSLDEQLLKEHRTYYQTRKKTHKKRINKLFETRDELVESLNAVRDKGLVRPGKDLDRLKRNEGKLFTRMGRAGDNEKKIARIQTQVDALAPKIIELQNGLDEFKRATEVPEFQIEGSLRDPEEE